MRIDIITGFPGLFAAPLGESIVKRAQQKGLIEIVVHDLRDYTHDRHRTIDDTPYGGGAGMVLKPEPIFECVDALRAEREYDEVLLTAAHGERFDQPTANRLSLLRNVIMICGHYKGVDHRVRLGLSAREISIGEYVLTGGELAAMVMSDAIARLIPGVIGDSESLLSDSFMDDMLDCPHYTRPPEYRGMAVPEELISGDHKRIAEWRRRHAIARTMERRPDLLSPDRTPEPG